MTRNKLENILLGSVFFIASPLTIFTMIFILPHFINDGEEVSVVHFGIGLLAIYIGYSLLLAYLADFAVLRPWIKWNEKNNDR